MFNGSNVIGKMYDYILDSGTGEASFMTNAKEKIYLDSNKIQILKYSLKYYSTQNKGCHIKVGSDTKIGHSLCGIAL